MSALFSVFRLFDGYRSPPLSADAPPEGETYYFLVGGLRLVCGTDAITVGAP